MEYDNILSSFITATATLGGLWLEQKLKERKKPDLSDKDYYDNLNEVLTLIKEEMDCDRACYFSFHNGEKTYDGFSIKHISLMAEFNKEEVEEIGTELQKIPVISFKRSIQKMKDLTELKPYLISYETEYKDKLSALCLSYGINTSISCKIKNNKKKNPWTGILLLGFKEDKKTFTQEKLDWLSFQIDRVNSVVTTMG